jgi:hypothetical protein
MQVDLPVLIVGQMEIIGGLIWSVARVAARFFSDQLALNFLFGGRVRAAHKTKFAVDKMVQRYAESIDSLNRAVMVSIAFVPIALFVAGSDVKLPLIDLSVKYRDWLRLCPAVSFGIQLFTLVAVCWFLLLRRGLSILQKEIGDVDYFGDVSNFMLKGIIGVLWIFVAIPAYLPSKWHLLWVLPLAVLFSVVLLSPFILCVHFVFLLYSLGDLLPAIIYSFLLVPSIGLAVILIGLSLVAGVQDHWFGAVHLSGLSVHSSASPPDASMTPDQRRQ